MSPSRSLSALGTVTCPRSATFVFIAVIIHIDWYGLREHGFKPAAHEETRKAAKGNPLRNPGGATKFRDHDRAGAEGGRYPDELFLKQVLDRLLEIEEKARKETDFDYWTIWLKTQNSRGN
jgi:hypothetical protein